MTCRHCHTRKASRARGLCSACSKDAKIRDRYPPARGYYGNRVDFNGGYALPKTPVVAIPGSEEKIKALARRVRQRVALHHPQDGNGF